MRSLQIITGIGHFGYQTAQPVVEFKLKQAAIFCRTDILALQDFQVMRNAESRKIYGRRELIRLFAVASGVSN